MNPKDDIISFVFKNASICSPVHVIFARLWLAFLLSFFWAYHLRIRIASMVQLRDVVDPKLMKRFVRMPHPDESMLQVVGQETLPKLGGRLVCNQPNRDQAPYMPFRSCCFNLVPNHCLCAEKFVMIHILMQVRSAVFFLLPTLLLVGLPTHLLARVHEVLPSQYRFLPVEWRSFYPFMAFQVCRGYLHFDTPKIVFIVLFICVFET